jgi:hypothetical protein
MNYNAHCGDIFLCDSDRTGAKIVKFLQQSPTIWHQIWRYFNHTLEPVRFYHAGMVLIKNRIMEQQWKVQDGDLDKILSRRIIIYRNTTVDSYLENLLLSRALEDLGKIYDIPQLIGKTFTWLTGLKFFVDILGGMTKEEEICVTRIGDWYQNICNFGVKYRSELTTKIIDEYCASHPYEWEVVYQNGV